MVTDPGSTDTAHESTSTGTGHFDAFGQSLLDAIATRACVVDGRGVIVAANVAWNEAEVPDHAVRVDIGDNVLAVWGQATGVAGARARATAAQLTEVLRTGLAAADELAALPHGPDDDVRWFRSRISPVAIPGGGALLMHVDVTDQVEAERALLEKATLDYLTGLPNRLLTLDRIDQAMSRSKRIAGSISVLMVDLDAFKMVNDSLGRVVGDMLIQAVAQRLAACLDDGAWLSRFTGDAFVVVIEGRRPEHRVFQLAERLRDAVQEPIHIDDREVVLTAGVGVAMATPQHHQAEDLIRDAEAAVKRSGLNGRGQIEIADGEVRSRAMARMETEQALRRAVANNEFRLAYQAEVSLDSGRVIGAEALLRWQRGDGPELQPEEFVALAEETGLIVSIGDWVLYEACRAAAQWPVVDGVGLFVAVNLSARQLVSPVLVDMVRLALGATGLPPERLCIELTESSLVGRLDDASAVLSRLRDLGVLVALDDFGTGYSSLSYLRQLPVDIVKLDRSFVEKIDTDPVARAIVGAVLSLAQSLGLSVVAEGVESEAQREELRQLGCDVVQGFQLGRPTDEASFIDLAVSRVDH